MPALFCGGLIVRVDRAWGGILRRRSPLLLPLALFPGFLGDCGEGTRAEWMVDCITVVENGVWYGNG